MPRGAGAAAGAAAAAAPLAADALGSSSLLSMNVSPFLWKTFSLVSDPATDSIVSWSPDGMTFTVWKPDVMVRATPRVARPRRGSGTPRRRCCASVGFVRRRAGAVARRNAARPEHGSCAAAASPPLCPPRATAVAAYAPVPASRGPRRVARGAGSRVASFRGSACYAARSLTRFGARAGARAAAQGVQALQLRFVRAVRAPAGRRRAGGASAAWGPKADGRGAALGR